MKLHLPENLLKFIQNHAVKAYPYECCGFLYGTADEAARRIEHVEYVDNSKEGDQRRRFEISPKDYLNAEKQAENLGYQLIGVYHSHPDHPSHPSEHDRSQAMPFFSYVITSVEQGRPGQIQSWRLNEQRRFEEEEILVDETALQ